MKLFYFQRKSSQATSSGHIISITISASTLTQHTLFFLIEIAAVCYQISEDNMEALLKVEPCLEGYNTNTNVS